MSEIFTKEEILKLFKLYDEINGKYPESEYEGKEMGKFFETCIRDGLIKAVGI